jgi:type IV pilus assembly protein PilV
MRKNFMAPAPSTRTRNTGFTLLEVLVALFVLAIGLLGLALLQTTGLRLTTNSYSRSQATYLAYDIIERMRANVAGLLAANYTVANTGAANTIVGGAAYTCNTTPGSCACEAVACSGAAAIASYDLGQWYYRLDNLLPGARDAANLSANPQRATIVVPDALNPNRVTVTVFWLEQEDNNANPLPKSQSWDVEIHPPSI